MPTDKYSKSGTEQDASKSNPNSRVYDSRVNDAMNGIVASHTQKIKDQGQRHQRLWRLYFFFLC